MSNLNPALGLLDLVFAFLPHLTIVSFICSLFIWWVSQHLAVYIDSRNHLLQILWLKREHRVGDFFHSGEHREVGKIHVHLNFQFAWILRICFFGVCNFNYILSKKFDLGLSFTPPENRIVYSKLLNVSLAE